MRQEGVVVLLELALVLFQVGLYQLLLDLQAVVAPVEKAGKLVKVKEHKQNILFPKFREKIKKLWNRNFQDSCLIKFMFSKKTTKSLRSS